MVENSSVNIKTRRNNRTFNLKEMYRKTTKSILHMHLNKRTSDPNCKYKVNTLLTISWFVTWEQPFQKDFVVANRMMEQRRVSRPPHERIGHQLVGLKFRCSEMRSGALWMFWNVIWKKACNDYFFMSARVCCICFFLLKSTYHLSSCLGGIWQLHWKGIICVRHPFWVLSWSSSSSMGFKAEFSFVVVHLCHFCICFYLLKSTYHLFPCLGGINQQPWLFTA